MSETVNIPTHVSIIMDGNGRWAKERGEERCFGHVEGVKSVRACAEEAVRKGVRYLSLFAFSEENWGRPQAEVSTLMELMVKAMKEEVDTILDNGIRFLVLGDRSRLSAKVLEGVKKIEEASSSNDRMTMIIFLSYSGKWDIRQAAEKMMAEGKGSIEDYLVTKGIPDPDLIIRTSGEQRLSNYMLWQAAYSEFYFTDTLWPDFRESDFDRALEDYSKRDRRYGKVK